MLRRLQADARLRPTTLAAHHDRYPPTRRLHLPESSWGLGKQHAAWVSEVTRPLWRALRAAEARFRTLPAGTAREAAWRQLSLTQASDWPFMVNHHSTPRYGRERFAAHLNRFDAACRGEDLAAIAAIDQPAAPRP